MEFIIALIPALAWGSTGIFNTKMGGSAAQQTLGTTFGALIFGLATMFFFVLPNGIAVTSHIWVVGFFSGIFWAVGMAGQLTSYKDMGVSLAYPISTAGQIVGNALLAAALLGDWHRISSWILGLIAIIMVTAGAIFTSAKSKADKKNNRERPESFIHGLIALLVSTIGFMLYFIFPNLMVRTGFISSSIHNANHGVDYMTAVVGPQAIGQVIGGFLIVIFIYKQIHTMFDKPTWKNIVTGLVWGAGNLFMFISAANPNIGQATATTLSQMGVIVGTFGGIYILGEKKTSDQMIKIIIGSILVVVGGILISNVNRF